MVYFLILLALNRAIAAQILGICEAWAHESNILFITDLNPKKSKVIFMCGRQKQLCKPAALILGDWNLPYIETATHLGNELHESGTMDYDTRVKNAQFISNSLETRELFSFASPAEVLRALKVYTCNFYGSNLWDLKGKTRVR